jgi:hypothetical protein
MLETVKLNLFLKYRLYLLIPCFFFTLKVVKYLQLIYFFPPDADMVYYPADGVTFFYGIVNSWFDPQNAYNDSYYHQFLISGYYYLPVFALIFYPMTVNGIFTFTFLFLYIGIVLYYINFYYLDKIFELKGVIWYIRCALISCLSWGYFIDNIFFYNQSKFYVCFLISMLIYGKEKNWNSWLLHILFNVLIGMMPYFILLYFYFITFEIKFRVTSSNLRSSKLTVNAKFLEPHRISIEKLFSFKHIFPVFQFFTSFILLNFLFLVNRSLIGLYYSTIRFSFLYSSITYLYRIEFSAFAYVFYNSLHMGEIGILLCYLLFFSLSFTIWIKSRTLITALGCYSVILLFFLPNNEPHYYIFLFQSIFMWTSFNHIGLSQRKKYEYFGIILLYIFITLIYHLFTQPFYSFFLIGFGLISLKLSQIGRKSKILD